MNIQTRASFKKEFLAYFRTRKFLIVALVVIGLSLLSPLLITGLGVLMDSMSDIYEDFGMDVSEMTGMLSSSSSLGVSSSVSDITGVGLIVLLILINSAAGGEQKKRAVMIPRSAGLRSFPYLFPKFIIYPLSVFILAIVAMFTSWAASSIVFEVNDVTFNMVLLAGILSGVCLMLYVCFHLALGTATGNAALSATMCIIASVLLPNVFALTDIEYMFNPFALDLLASSVIVGGKVTGAEVIDIVITIIFALAIMIGTYFISLFANNAKKIDNSGNDIDL